MKLKKMERKYGFSKANMKVNNNKIRQFYLFLFLIEKNSKADSSVFWTSCYVYAVAWTVLFVWEVIRFKFVWAIIGCIMLVFAGTNLYGYLKCSKDQQSNLMKLGTKAMFNVAKKGADVAKEQI